MGATKIEGVAIEARNRTGFRRTKREMTAPASPPPVAPRRIWAMRALIVMAIVAAYANTLHAPFLLDDESSIAANPSIRQLWPPAAATVGGTRGRPLANASFALNYAWGGLNVTGYHAVNVALHAATALLLFALVRRALRREPRWSDRADWIAGMGALLWAVHPLLTNAVTYLAQRTEVLMAFFYVATLYAFARSLETEDTREARTWRLMSVLACLAGTGAKEIIGTAPLAVLLYDRAFGTGTVRAAWRERKGYYLALASTWLLLAWLMSHAGERGIGADLTLTPIAYALAETRAVLAYLKLAIWPAPLVFDYGPFVARPFADDVLSASIVASLLGAIALSLWRWPKRGLLLAWPLLVLAPTSTFVPIAFQPMAENRMYLPLAAVTLAVSLGIFRYLPRMAAMVGVAAAGVLLVMTFERNATYESAPRLWQDTVDKKPTNDRAWTNLGMAWFRHGDLPKARASLRRAVEINPRGAEAWNNLGLVEGNMGLADSAIADLRRAIELVPTFTEAHYNLGSLLLMQQRPAEAEAPLEKAVALSPAHAAAHFNLAVALVELGQLEGARVHLDEARRLNPGDPMAEQLRREIEAKRSVER